VTLSELHCFYGSFGRYESGWNHYVVLQLSEDAFKFLQNFSISSQAPHAPPSKHQLLLVKSTSYFGNQYNYNAETWRSPDLTYTCLDCPERNRTDLFTNIVRDLSLIWRGGRLPAGPCPCARTITTEAASLSSNVQLHATTIRLCRCFPVDSAAAR